MIAGEHTETPRLIARLADEQVRQGISPAVEAVFRSRLLDFIANVVGGAALPPSRALDAYLERFPGTVAVPSGRASSEAAALAHAVASHCLECDDTHQPSSSHPGSVIFPAVLAVGSEVGASLDAVARATVVGYEVMCRLGEAAGPADQYRRGFHPSGTLGVFGAAAAVGVLLDLDIDRAADAIGLAASCSSGSMSFLEGGGWSKLLNCGHAASAGITAARLAAAGFEGPHEAIAGPHGFLAGHSDGQRLGALETTGETRPPAIERTSVKAHGCCRYEQGPIDAILDLRKRHGFGSADVASVRVGMLDGGWGIVAEPLEAKRRPSSIVESQFSMPYGAALAIVLGRAAAPDHNVANLRDPEILRVCDLVECYRDPELDALYPDRWPTVVRVTLRDGTELEQRVDYPKGDPENPFTDDELIDKLWTLAPEANEADVAAVSSLVLAGDLNRVQAGAVLDGLVPLWHSVRTRAV
jgi:2-methylcitrate dehydratase PrpD